MKTQIPKVNGCPIFWNSNQLLLFISPLLEDNLQSIFMAAEYSFLFFFFALKENYWLTDFVTHIKVQVPGEKK